MERFAKRKILVFDYLNCYRVFYKEDSGKKYFVCDVRTKSPDFIALEVKKWYDNRKRKGKFYVVLKDGMLRDVITDSHGKKKYFETINDAEEWIDGRSYKGMSYSFEVLEEKDESSN